MLQKPNPFSYRALLLPEDLCFFCQGEICHKINFLGQDCCSSGVCLGCAAEKKLEETCAREFLTAERFGNVFEEEEEGVGEQELGQEKGICCTMTLDSCAKPSSVLLHPWLILFLWFCSG